MGKDDIIYKNESYAIIGAAMRVHQVLGQGFAEKVYQDALEIEFKKRGIPYEREKQYHITYDGIVLNHIFQPDFVCYDKIVVELTDLRNTVYKMVGKELVSSGGRTYRRYELSNGRKAIKLNLQGLNKNR